MYKFNFNFRIQEIGWTSRQKFEEIWMSFLGILNLTTEDDVRAEEQASVVQVPLARLELSKPSFPYPVLGIHKKATCEAVRGLTMVLQKNLPFTQADVLRRKSAKFSEFMRTEYDEKTFIVSF